MSERDISFYEMDGTKPPVKKQNNNVEIQIPEFLRPHSKTPAPESRNPFDTYLDKHKRKNTEDKDELFSKHGTAKTFPVPSPHKLPTEPFRLENEEEVNDLIVSLELMFGEYRARVYCLCIAYKYLLKYKENKKHNYLLIAEWYIDKYFSYDPKDGEVPVPFCFEKREDYELDQKARNMMNYIVRESL